MGFEFPSQRFQQNDTKEITELTSTSVKNVKQVLNETQTDEDFLGKSYTSPGNIICRLPLFATDISGAIEHDDFLLDWDDSNDYLILQNSCGRKFYSFHLSKIDSVVVTTNCVKINLEYDDGVVVFHMWMYPHQLDLFTRAYQAQTRVD